MSRSVANSTGSKYSSHYTSYQLFCKNHGIKLFPITQQSLILFATYLSPSMSHKNINAHLSAIKYFAHIYGFDDDFSRFHRLYRLMRGIKRTQASKFKKAPRLPVTPDLLGAMSINLWHSSYKYEDKLMLWAAMLTAFFGFLRVSEYTSSHVHSHDPQTTLLVEDLDISSSNMIIVSIKASKTDPFKCGTCISLHRNTSALCPVTALKDYMFVHPKQHGPCFVWQDGRNLTRSNFSTALLKLKPTGVTNLTTHSFRIGAATTAAAAGHPRWLIQALGRWSSDCYRDYIRIPQTTLSNVSQSLTFCHPNPQRFDPDHV